MVLKGALPPIGLALLLVSLGGVRLLPLAVVGGLFVAYGLLKAWPALPHELWSSPNGTEWLLWSVAAAGLATAFERVGLWRGRIAAGVAVALAAVSVWLVLQKVAAAWSPVDVWLHVGGGGLLLALLAVGHRVVLARAPAGWFPAALFSVLLSVDAAVLTLGKSALLGQLCGAVAAALGAAAGTTLWKRPFALTAADGTWLGIAHGLFVLAGVHLASLPWPAAGCALVAPLVLLLLRDGVGATRPKTWALVASLLVLVPLAGAVWFALGEGSEGY